MAGKKVNAKNSGAAGRSNGHHPKAAAGTVTKGPGRRETPRPRPSANELALRAWAATYKNSKGREA
jgi:hypothetical protein